MLIVEAQNRSMRAEFHGSRHERGNPDESSHIIL